MTIEALIEQYGYLALFAGTFLEGETILVVAGFAAHRGYLTLGGVFLYAFLGSLAGDQFFFLVGRWRGASYLARKTEWQSHVEKVNRLLNRYRLAVLLGFRFMYGLRSVTPFVIGLSDIPVATFLPLNALGAAVWAVLGGTGGYYLGSALETFLGDLKDYERKVMVGVAAVGLIVWAIHFIRKKKAAGNR